jgi:uncharacterized protein (DUF342 family)
MTDNKEMKRDFEGVGIDDSLFDLFDEHETYVRVSEDEQHAWMHLMPKEDGTPYTKDDLIDILHMNGVCAGINEDILIAMAKKEVYEREIKVAEAVAPVEGRDGYYEYFFETDNTTKKPDIREDGSVDYQSMNMLNNVKKGDVLAKYHPAVQGTQGEDVRGGIIAVQPVKNLLPLQGKGIVRSTEDENLYLADQEGKVEYKDGRISLSNIHEITGDVDQIIGKVEFYGDVLISGNVEAGTLIRAGKSLTIEGTVEAATLISGGDIILKRGIQGNQKAKISCRGNLYADFIEHTQVRAGGNVEANIILNSEIEAEGKVILTGKKGTLIGGNVHGTQGIDCKELGNDVEVKTIVHAGCLPDVLQKKRKLLQEDGELKKALDTLTERFKEIEVKVKALGAISSVMEQELLTIKQKKQALDEKREDCREKLLGVNHYIDRAKGAKIRVDGKLYKGSIICIDQARMPVENTTMYMEYRNISGMIAGNVIVKN